MARFLKLNRGNIKALQAGSKLTEQGVTAERTTSGDIRYSVNVMTDGRRVHRVLGLESEGTTLSQCIAFIEQARTDARHDRLSLPTGRKTHLSLAEAAPQYLSSLEKTGGKGIARKRQQLVQHLVPALGSKTLRAISENDLKAYRRQRRDDGTSDATINRELATLSHLFRQAASAHRWISKDDIPSIPRTSEEGGRFRVLSDEEGVRLLTAAVQDQDRDLWLFVIIGMNTCMRHSEITSIRIENIDLDQRRIFLPKAKAGQRVQPITPTLADILKAETARRDSKQGWLFPSCRRGTKYGRRTHFTAQFKRAVLRAGLCSKEVTPHVMRHTGITRLVVAGVNLPTVMQISGHRTLKMVLRYVHVSAPHIDSAINHIDTAVPVTPTLHTRV